MKTLSTSTFLLLFFIFSFSHCTKTKKEQSAKPFKISKAARINGAYEHEFDKTHDPELGIIPYERLREAENYYFKNRNAYKTNTPFSTIQWRPLGPNNVGGRTRAILFIAAKKVIAAGVTGGLWITNDITQSNPNWTPIGDFLNKSINISCIAQDPNDLKTIYAGTGEAFGQLHIGAGIFKSIDTGKTWSLLGSTSNNNDFSYVSRLLVSKDGDLYAATKGFYCNVGGGLMKSTNGGTTWSRVLGANGTSCLNGTDLSGADLDENNAGDLFFASAGPSGHIYISNKTTHGANVGNAGNWSDITPTGTWNRIEIAVSKKANSGVLYATLEGSASNDVTGLYYSTNKGSSWTSRNVPTICDFGQSEPYTRGQAWYDQTVAIDPTDDDILYLGGVDLVKSTDAGATFSQITTWSVNNWSIYNCAGSAPRSVHADHHALVFNPFTANAAISGNDGGLYYSTNMSNSLPNWSQKNDGYITSQYYALATHPTNSNYVLGGTQDNGSHKLSTNGLGAGTSASGGDGGFCHIKQNNATYQLTSYVYNNHYLSSDGGTTFPRQTGSNVSTGRFINPSDLDNANNILFSAGNSDFLEYRTGVTSGSLTRNTINLGFGGTKLSALTVSPNNTSTLYAGDDQGRIYKITDRSGTPTKAATWSLPNSGYVSSIDVWKHSNGVDDSILVTLSNYGVNSVFYTSNGSNTTPTWIDIDDNNTLQDMPVRWGIFSKEGPSKVFIATDLGVLATSNINGNSTAWTIVNNNYLPNVRVDMLAYDADGNLVVGTHGRGIWETKEPCSLANSLPTAPGTYTSTVVRRDNGYDCYCDNNGNLLLALDTAGSGANIPFNAVSLQIGNSFTTSWNNAGGIITNSAGGAAINRKWNVNATTQPISGQTVKVRSFFTNTEYSAVVTALANLSSSTSITHPNQLQMYKMTNGGAFADPHAAGATGIILNHNATPSTTQWLYGSKGSDHYAEFLVSSFSGGGGGGGGGNAPLPVELLAFDAYLATPSAAKLLWKTGEEINNQGFEIQRSVNGRDFIKIALVNGAGNANNINSYDFWDYQLPSSKVLYYRLKQIDFDGHFEYSPIRKVVRNSEIKPVFYPNPAKDYISTNVKDLVSVLATDLQGRKSILAFSNSKIDISALKVGIYLLEIRTSESSYFQKIIKQ